MERFSRAAETTGRGGASTEPARRRRGAPGLRCAACESRREVVHERRYPGHRPCSLRAQKQGSDRQRAVAHAHVAKSLRYSTTSEYVTAWISEGSTPPKFNVWLPRGRGSTAT